MTEISSTHNKASESTKINHLHGWRRIFLGIRPRILVWYFLLMASTTLVSISATRKILCDQIEQRTEGFLAAEVERFQRLANQQDNRTNQLRRDDVANLFDQFLSSYVPTRNESIFTLLSGQPYKFSNQSSLPDILKQHPNLVSKWAALTQQERGRVNTPNGPIFYVAQPVKINTETPGVVIAVYDATSDYLVGRGAIFLVIQITMVILVLFWLLAWITAGRVLSPLRLLTETAEKISESDMTRRLSVQGSDEIAELSVTFNKMLDRLQFANTRQQEFIKNAGHELRTPITIIQGHLEILNYQPQRQSETIELVTDELQRMNRLVNDLLLLVRAERADFLNPKPEELDWLTEELYLKARALANRNWQLESKGLSPIVVDRGRLTQAVMNLVQNAVRHTQQGDAITLGSAVKNSYAYFWVRDTGEGIAPVDQQRIFERFARATNSDRCSEGEGAGLGLSITEAIATAHLGWVELDSSLGYGSTFTIVIPLVSTFEVAQKDEPDSPCRRQPSHHRISHSRIAGSRVHDDSR